MGRAFTYNRNLEVLIMERKNLWKTYTEAERAELQAIAEDYKAFLSAGKT